MKPILGEKYIEVSFKIDPEMPADEKLVQDIAEFNLQVELAAQAEGPARHWLQRLT